VNAQESTEDYGRAKRDLEVCAKRASDSQHRFWDPDYGDIDGDGVQDTCNRQELGSEVEWLTQSYVKNYPNAVYQGIDDDWNSHLESTSGSFQNYTSRPFQDSYTFDMDGDGTDDTSPVSTGSINTSNQQRSIATLGFCAGDDEDEYRITQTCHTDLCSTDSSVVGVSDSPGSCVLNGQDYPVDPAYQDRKVYRSGENVTFDLGSRTSSMACYSGVWYDQWPVVMETTTAEVELGQETGYSFRILNVENQRRTYTVTLEDTDASRFVTMSEGDSFKVDVPARSTKTVAFRVYGGDESINNGAINIRVDSENGDQAGTATMMLDIVKNRNDPDSASINSVPGIGALQIFVVSLIATAAVYLL
jgi:hypothetical protein